MYTVELYYFFHLHDYLLIIIIMQVVKIIQQQNFISNISSVAEILNLLLI